MLAVQVERDPKTGATIVRSVAPVSTPAGAPKATAIFDDGRKSIHAISGSVGQPSSEELGQILSVIDGVGMKALLDDVTVTPTKIERDAIVASKGSEKNDLALNTHPSTAKEDSRPLGSSRSDDSKAELSRVRCAVSVGNADDKNMMALRYTTEKVDTVKEQMLEESPVTLVFLGYADATTDLSPSQEDQEGAITVERVIITEDGEEHVLGPEMPAPLYSPLDQVAEQDTRKEFQEEAVQEIPSGGNGAGVKVQAEEGDKELHNESPPSIAEGEGRSKHKICQCCSVM
ncbi:uncharacterized protein LOC115784369 isoform X2 [Archocentrus centrarchus]|nr:uncharacterized protein LOC115784369 isoform X2 [Archocentrus centrarchus]